MLPEFIPLAGIIVSFATTPIAFLVVAAAYRQLMTSPPPEIVESYPTSPA
ncbi:MAG: hypothetical protein HZA46_10940 [Planctomycetales bacterium]|nr:hypothetical protein [Planctomycetales bacterium]